MRKNTLLGAAYFCALAAYPVYALGEAHPYWPISFERIGVAMMVAFVAFLAAGLARSE